MASLYAKLEELVQRAQEAPLASPGGVIGPWARVEASDGYVLVMSTIARRRWTWKSVDLYTADEWLLFRSKYIDGDVKVPFRMCGKEYEIEWEKIDARVVFDPRSIAVMRLIDDLITNDISDLVELDAREGSLPLDDTDSDTPASSVPTKKVRFG